MATIAVLVGGALVNAIAFSGSNLLFSSLKGGDAERERHDKAVEQLQAAHDKWSKKRTQRLDWINRELKKQGHSLNTFQDVDSAIREYNLVTAGAPDAGKLTSVSEPVLSDFYNPSEAQKDREIAFIVLGMGALAFIGYKLI